MNTVELDEIDQILLTELTQNARTPASALAQVVGLTRQAVSDRMERLRDDGIIAAYTIAIAPKALGVEVRGFVEVVLLPGTVDGDERLVVDLLAASPWVRECYRMSGDGCLKARIAAPSIAAIRDLALELRATRAVEHTRTFIALETLFEKSAVGYPPGASVLAPSSGSAR